jgi:hypothetical protein
MYADDTIIFANNAKRVSQILQGVEAEANKYNFSLNRLKCAAMFFNSARPVTFSNGEKVQEVTEYTYLGGHISKTMSPAEEIANKLRATWPILRKLDIFWRLARVPKAWKIQAHQAIIESKLLYGLETVQATNAQLAKLDTFQLKGFRKILGITTTFVNRNNTNKKVFHKINKEVLKRGVRPDTAKYKIIPISEQVHLRKLKLLGHLIREKGRGYSPMYDLTFQDNLLSPRISNNRRVGRPRGIWGKETVLLAWKLIKTFDDPQGELEESFEYTLDQIEEIKNRAMNRILPFSRKRKGTLWRENHAENENQSQASESDVVETIMGIFGQESNVQPEQNEEMNHDSQGPGALYESGIGADEAPNIEMREGEDIMDYIDRLFGNQPDFQHPEDIES